MDTEILRKEEYDILSRETPSIVRGIVYIPATKMGEFSGFFCIKAEYFSEQQLSQFLVYPGFEP